MLWKGRLCCWFCVCSFLFLKMIRRSVLFEVCVMVLIGCLLICSCCFVML